MEKYLKTPRDSGQADYYYGRNQSPHYYDSFNERETNLTPEEIEEYNKGYESYEKDRIQKEWN